MGVLSSTSATTASNGEASTRLTLGSKVESYTVTASVSGIAQQVTFMATATDPPRATRLESVSGDGQSAKINEHLRNPLVVKVLDQNGDALSGATVTFSVTPSSGVLMPTSATTASNGETSTVLQLGNTVGTYTVTASVSGVNQQVMFTATATDPPRATTLQLVSGDKQSDEINQPLDDPLVVRVLDQNGAAFPGATVNFTVNPTSGSLSPTSATTASNGEASTTLTLGGTAERYTVTASAPGTTQPVTFTATATNPPLRATTLELVSGNNQSAQVSQPLPNALVVKVLDQNGDAFPGCHSEFYCESKWRSESYKCDHSVKRLKRVPR